MACLPMWLSNRVGIHSIPLTGCGRSIGLQACQVFTVPFPGIRIRQGPDSGHGSQSAVRASNAPGAIIALLSLAVRHACMHDRKVWPPLNKNAELELAVAKLDLGCRLVSFLL